MTARRRGKRVEDEKLPKKVRYEQKEEYLYLYGYYFCRLKGVSIKNKTNLFQHLNVLIVFIQIKIAIMKKMTKELKRVIKKTKKI